jgi:hypothetical protein
MLFRNALEVVADAIAKKEDLLTDDKRNAVQDHLRAAMETLHEANERTTALVA